MVKWQIIDNFGKTCKNNCALTPISFNPQWSYFNFITAEY